MQLGMHAGCHYRKKLFGNNSDLFWMLQKFGLLISSVSMQDSIKVTS